MSRPKFKPQGRAVKLDGYRMDPKTGKLVRHQPRLNASARIAQAKTPKQRYVGGGR